MMAGDLWIAAVIVLQSCAALTFLFDGDWKQAIVWLGVAVSNIAYLSLSRL